MTLSYQAPSGWRFPTIEEISLQEKGAIRIGPFGSALKKHEYSEAGVRVLGIEDVFPNELVSDRRKFIPEAKYRELRQYTVAPGDILVTNMGTVGRTCVVPNDLERSIISSHLIKVSLDLESALPSYISWMLNFCPLVVAQIKAKCHGAIMAGFNSGLLKQLHIPLPPLAEQRRIAEVLARAEALRAKRYATLARLDSLTQSLFLDLFGDPVSNPRKWPQENLETFFLFKTGKLDSNAAVASGQYPFFTCSREDYRIDTYAFDCEALLLAGNNASADYSVKHYKGKFNAYQRTYVITLRDEHNSYDYARLVLEQRLAELKRISKGTNTKYLTMELLNRIRIPVPPQELQREFARRVRAVEKLKTAQRASLAELDALFATLQHRAFRGEL